MAAKHALEPGTIFTKHAAAVVVLPKLSTKTYTRSTNKENASIT